MPLFTVDSKNVLGKMVEEAGSYNVKIVRSDVSKSGRGNQYISIDYQVIDGKYKDAEIRFQNLTWSNDDPEQSTKRFNTVLVAIGVADGTPVDSVEQCAKAMLGKTLNIDVDWDEPNMKGNIYLRVRGYHRVNQDGSQPNGIKRPQSGSQGSSASNEKSLEQNDPFANSKGANDAVNITDDDLPFD